MGKAGTIKWVEGSQLVLRHHAQQNVVMIVIATEPPIFLQARDLTFNAAKVDPRALGEGA